MALLVLVLDRCAIATALLAAWLWYSPAAAVCGAFPLRGPRCGRPEPHRHDHQPEQRAQRRTALAAAASAGCLALRFAANLLAKL